MDPLVIVGVAALVGGRVLWRASRKDSKPRPDYERIALLERKLLGIGDDIPPFPGRVPKALQSAVEAHVEVLAPLTTHPRRGAVCIAEGLVTMRLSEHNGNEAYVGQSPDMRATQPGEADRFRVTADGLGGMWEIPFDGGPVKLDKGWTIRVTARVDTLGIRQRLGMSFPVPLMEQVKR